MKISNNIEKILQKNSKRKSLSTEWPTAINNLFCFESGASVVIIEINANSDEFFDFYLNLQTNLL